MPRRNDISKILMALRPVALISFLLACAASVMACSISAPRYMVQSSFRVFVEHEKKPVSGIEVTLYRDQGKNSVGTHARFLHDSAPRMDLSNLKVCAWSVLHCD